MSLVYAITKEDFIVNKKVISFLLTVFLIVGTLFSYENSVTAEAASAVTVKPKKVTNVEKILPTPTIYYPATEADTYNYIFKFTLDEASVVRINALSRYAFWNWGGSTNYSLIGSSVKETWKTSANADCSWELQGGNYSDKIFTLNKGTYYLYVSTNLQKDWQEVEHNGFKPTDYDIGFWLAINTATYTKTPTLKSCTNKTGSQVLVKYSKVSKAAGYAVQYSTSSKFKSAKSVSSTKTSATIKKLKKKTYYVRVRAYRLLDGKKYYSAWSKVKKVSVKK